MTHAVQTLEKQPRESRMYRFDFSPRMTYGETISEVISVDVLPDDSGDVPTPLELGAPAAGDQVVQMRISSGFPGRKYKISVVIRTSNANVLELDGFIWIREK